MFSFSKDADVEVTSILLQSATRHPKIRHDIRDIDFSFFCWRLGVKRINGKVADFWNSPDKNNCRHVSKLGKIDTYDTRMLPDLVKAEVVLAAIPVSTCNVNTPTSIPLIETIHCIADEFCVRAKARLPGVLGFNMADNASKSRI